MTTVTVSVKPGQVQSPPYFAVVEPQKPPDRSRNIAADRNDPVDPYSSDRGFHHIFEKWGWAVNLINGQPWWTPPTSDDPHQHPIRNHAHHHPLDHTQPAARSKSDP
jgi:hypothetical protein